MCAEPVVVGGMDPAKMSFPKHDDMIEALASNRTDEALQTAILPRGARRDGSIPHTSELLCDRFAISATAIAH
jgi:hypothetical protein